jgi:glycogen debranching enzyme
VFDSHGDIGAVGGAEGLFHSDTRSLSQREQLKHGQQLLLLGSNLRDDNTLLTVDLTNPDMYFDDHLVLPKDTLHVVRTIFLWHDTFYQRLAIQNHGDRAVDLRLTMLFDSDFADLFEVRGLSRSRRGAATAQVVGHDRVVLAYRGLDGEPRSTTVTFDPAPTALAEDHAIYRLELAPGKSRPIGLTVGCNEPPSWQRVVSFTTGLLAAGRELRAATRDATTVETSNELFNEILCRSAADLQMLMTDTPDGRYPYAGIPWYSTTFGRDGLITAIQMLWCDPGIARGVLRRLAAHQSSRNDPVSDAQPGKILHEMRSGEMAALGEVPFALYYGSVDATPLFVLLAGLYAERTGDLETLRSLWPAVEAGLAWIDHHGDVDGDGFVEYFRESESGLVNQGWKDSFDAIFHADGKLATGPIALAEVQGYVYAAKSTLARCARRLNLKAQAARLEGEARLLAEKFDREFWCDDLGIYALALDGDKQPCRVATSNMGQVLFSGIARPDRARAVAAALMQKRFFSGWGIRTVAGGEARYNPMSYHNGSVWPHDNALIALGLARYGFKPEVEQVFKGLFDAATYMDLRRLPELFCGFRRRANRGPTLYPVACSPQAWASATPFSLIEAALGLELDPVHGEIRLRSPRLPEFLDDVMLRNLHLGDARIDLRVRRHDHAVSVEFPKQSGQVRVSIISSS